MKRIYIVSVDDEPEILESLQRDLSVFEDVFPTEYASSSEEARALIEDLQNQGDEVGLIICDHMMPGQLGVDFLIELNKKKRTAGIRKTLITGQAGLDATINAVNKASLKHYLPKPWTKEALLAMVRHQLVEYILETERDPLPYYATLQDKRLLESIQDHGSLSDE